MKVENIKQCCTHSPVWIFIYSDGRIFAICENDYNLLIYRYGVKEIINIQSKVSFTPGQLFGGRINEL